jgi:hypothetical protein
MFLLCRRTRFETLFISFLNENPFHFFPRSSSAAHHVLSSLFQFEVTSATLHFKVASVVLWTTPEVKGREDWQKECGDKLASHLGTCGFESSTQGNKID